MVQILLERHCRMARVAEIYDNCGSVDVVHPIGFGSFRARTRQTSIDDSQGPCTEYTSTLFLTFIHDGKGTCSCALS